MNDLGFPQDFNTPKIDSTENNIINEGIGNKGDAAASAITSDQSLIAYAKGILTAAEGSAMIATKTIDLNQAAGTYDLFVGTAQDCSLESLSLRLPNVDCSDDAAITSFSIQTDDVTQSVIISEKLKVYMTAESTFSFTGFEFIKVGTKIQLTINGGAADAATVCDVVAKYVTNTNGGYLI